ncbi:MAG: MMPL family transporter, partial [Gemmataceae bacterium]
YEKLPIVSRVVEVASLVPGQQDDKLPKLADIERRLEKLPARGRIIPHAEPSVRLLKTELECLAGSLQPLADNCPKAQNRRVLTELRHSLLDLRDRLDEEDAAGLRQFEERLAGDLAEDLHQLKDVSHAQAITLADLPTGLRERYVGKSGKWLLRVFGKDSLWEYEPLVHFADEIRTVDAEATGKPFATLEGLQAMRSGFLWAGLYALLAIVTVLIIDFRKPRYILAALTPLALGLVMLLGIMGLYGLPLNPANMIALPLILGIGIDNGIHVVHDYKTRRRQGTYVLSRATGRGIMVASLTTILGFGTLMISHHRGLFGLGLVLALGVACCMLASLVFLPAMLSLMGQKQQKRRAAAITTLRFPQESRRAA